MKKIAIAVMDGKGGGLGRAMVEAIQTLPKERFNLYALGTNAQATRVMMAAGAKDGATGENAICYMAGKMDIIVGPLAILVGNAMMGEITPAMAAAVSLSRAQKLLFPLQRCGIRIVGTDELTMKQMLTELPNEVQQLMDAMEKQEDEIW